MPVCSPPFQGGLLGSAGGSAPRALTPQGACDSIPESAERSHLDRRLSRLPSGLWCPVAHGLAGVWCPWNLRGALGSPAATPSPPALGRPVMPAALLTSAPTSQPPAPKACALGAILGNAFKCSFRSTSSFSGCNQPVYSPLSSPSHSHVSRLSVLTGHLCSATADTLSHRSSPRESRPHLLPHLR